MRKWLLSASFALSLSVLPTIATWADDPKATAKPDDKPSEAAKPADTIPTKLPDYSKEFAKTADIAGTVMYADATSVMIQIKYKVRSGNGYKDETKNYTLNYAEGALARTKVQPMRADAKGKFVKVPASELEPRKKPTGAPGWHVERTDLKPGDIVNFEMIRPKSITEAKVTIEDKLIKMAIVVGETAPPKISRDQADAIEAKKKMEKKKAGDEAGEKKAPEKKAPEKK